LLHIEDSSNLTMVDAVRNAVNELPLPQLYAELSKTGVNYAAVAPQFY